MWVEGCPRAAFGVFLAVHFAVWTALPTLLYANLPLDLIEALTYGPHWVLGSDKLPPLPWWLVEVMDRLFGVDASYYALAEVVVIAAFVAVWAMARSLVGSIGALVAILIVDGMHYFNYTAVKFNHDVIQLPFWALAGYAFHAALKRGNIRYWLLLGLAFGGALWAKYFVVVLATPCVLFLILDRRARKSLATPGPWLALAVAFIVVLPHLVWLVQNDFVPFAYVNARAEPVHGWYDHITHPAAFAVSQAFFLLPTFFIAGALLWPPPTAHQEFAADAFDRHIVTVLALGPVITMIAVTALTGRGAIAMWGYPLWLFLGLWIVLTLRTVLTAERLAWVISAWSLVSAVLALAFVINYTVLPLIDHRYRAEFFPGNKLAAEITQRFYDATGQKLRYVIGETWDAGNIAHYSPDHPEVLIDGQLHRAPWIDLNDLRAKGAVVVWTTGDFNHLPARFDAFANSAVVGTPFSLPMRRGYGEQHIGWALIKPR